MLFRSEQPPYNGQSACPQPIVVYISTSEIGATSHAPDNGQTSRPSKTRCCTKLTPVKGQAEAAPKIILSYVRALAKNERRVTSMCVLRIKCILQPSSPLKYQPSRLIGRDEASSYAGADVRSHHFVIFVGEISLL